MGMAFALLFLMRASLTMCSSETTSEGLIPRPLDPAADGFYTVFASDPDNVYQVRETEKYLKSISGKDVVGNLDRDEKLVSWKVHLQNNATEELVGSSNIAGFEHASTSFHQLNTYSTVDEGPRLWVVWPKDPHDEKQVQETEDWLKMKSMDKSQNISTYRHVSGEKKGKVRSWGQVSLDDALVREARNHPGIKDLECHLPWKYASATFPEKKRASLEWKKQFDAPFDLKVVSQWKGAPEYDNLDFVHEKRAGDGARIYIIDTGVEVNVMRENAEKEFLHWNKENLLQTEESKEKHQALDTDEDHINNGHGTAVASKALGQKYGIAKGAFLVSVKTTTEPGDIANALELVHDDLERRKHNKEKGWEKSVVSISMGSAETYHGRYDAIRSHLGEEIYAYLEVIFAYGIPVVSAAGNEAVHANREKVDTLPSVLVSNEIPLIVVGAASFKGEPAPFSQGTDSGQATIFAPGVDVDMQFRRLDWESGTGTSYAAPAVAGLIATYLAYDNPPWGEAKGPNRVKAIRNYLTSDASSWARKNNYRMIWNGANDDAHKAAGSVCCRKNKRCYGINDRRYVARDTLFKLAQQFCGQAARFSREDNGLANGLDQTYLQTTVEEVFFRTSWNTGEKLDVTKCNKYMRELVDDCDTNNPMNWKGGGYLEYERNTYEIRPKVQRQPAMDKPKGGCKKYNNPTSRKGSHFEIWGAGWLGSDNGKALHEKLRDEIDWAFGYEVKDQREWLLRVSLPDTEGRARDSVKQAIKEVSNLDLQCD